MRRTRLAISTDLKIGLIIGTFVGVVVLGLVIVNLGYVFFPSTTTTNSQSPAISLSGITLYSGSPSTVSYNSTCQGDAIIQVYMTNNSPNILHITNATIYGSAVPHNGSALLSVSSNSCLPLSQADLALQPDSQYILNGYLNIPLALGTTCNFQIVYDNGQSFTQILIAQDA